MSNQFEVTLKPSKHKRKTFRHMIITSNDVADDTRLFRYHPNLFLVLSIVLCIIIGALVGFIFFQRQLQKNATQTIAVKDSEIAALNAEKINLNNEIDSLNNTIRILSDTVNIKTANENELMEVIEAQWIPAVFPLTGSASIIDLDSEIPMNVFKVTDGATVIASATGIVEDIYEDENYGNVVVIDHKNGYKTYYRNMGTVMVKKGDDVVQGTTIYIINSDNNRVCYQIEFNGEFIDPLTTMEIKG